MKFNFENAPLQIIDGDRGENYPKKEEFSNSGYCLFLSTANVTKSGFDFKQCNFISKEKDNALRKGKLVRGDVVLTTRGTIGNSAYYSDQISFDNIRINSGMVIFRVNQEKLLPYYLYLFLNSKDFLSQSESLQSGAAQPQLPIKDIRKLEINIPDLETQKKIASTLSHYDDLIQTNQQRIALLEEAAQRLYDEWFVKLRFPNYQQVPVVDGVPEGWEKVKLADIAKINAKSIKNGEFEYIRYVDISAVGERCIQSYLDVSIDEAAGRAKRKVRHGDIIWSCVRPNRRQYAMIWEPVANLIVSTGFCTLTATQVPFTYLYSISSDKALSDYLEAVATGSAYPAVTATDFETHDVLKPTDEILKKYHLVCLPLISQAETLKIMNTKLTQARDELLPRLMSGQLNVIL